MTLVYMTKSKLFGLAFEVQRSLSKVGLSHSFHTPTLSSGCSQPLNGHLRGPLSILLPRSSVVP